MGKSFLLSNISMPFLIYLIHRICLNYQRPGFGFAGTPWVHLFQSALKWRVTHFTSCIQLVCPCFDKAALIIPMVLAKADLGINKLSMVKCLLLVLSRMASMDLLTIENRLNLEWVVSSRIGLVLFFVNRIYLRNVSYCWTDTDYSCNNIETSWVDYRIVICQFV